MKIIFKKIIKSKDGKNFFFIFVFRNVFVIRDERSVNKNIRKLARRCFHGKSLKSCSQHDAASAADRAAGGDGVNQI